MLANALEQLTLVAQTLTQALSHSQLVGLSVLFAVLASWGTWRLWRFTLQPLLQPNEPRELPYWIPVFGHAGSFFQDSHRLMRRAVSRLGSKEPFSLMIAGDRYYVVSSSPDTCTYFADAASLTWDGFLNQVLVGFGCGPDRLGVLWEENPKSEINPKGKHLIHLTEDLFKKHLLPGRTFDKLLSRYRIAIKQLLTWDAIGSKYGLETPSQSKPISLYDLCSHFMIDATQMSLFDPILFSIDPNMTSGLRFFTDELWKLLHPTKMVDSTEVKRLLKQYTQAFKIYQRLPKDLRKNETWVISTLIDEYQRMGIHEDDSAAMLVMIYWTGDANAYKAAFWTLAYIMYDPTLYAIIREETAPGIGADGQPDLIYLTTQCPRLNSIYNEVLRLTKRDNIFRRATKDLEIAGKSLRADRFVIIPTCQLHENVDVYGSDVLSFSPDRFLKHPELVNDPSYRPYGGGRNYCPGRYFAMHEMFAFIAVVINRYNIQLSHPGQKFPERDESLFTLGVSRPLPGSDLLVTLSNEK